jgi:hypothetical protein
MSLTEEFLTSVRKFGVNLIEGRLQSRGMAAPREAHHAPFAMPRSYESEFQMKEDSPQ